MMSQSDDTVEQWKKEYEHAQHNAEQLAQQLRQQLSQALEREGIYLGLPVQARVKKWDSLVDKLRRKSDRYKCVADVHDLVGLRIIVLFPRDVAKVSELVRRLLSVVEEDDVSRRLKDREFGYKSIHFTATIPQDWKSVPSFEGLEGMRAEIQVRTVAQHNWAAAEHYLQYKTEKDAPPSMQRSIHRLSALLEIVDLEFERLLTEQEMYNKTIGTLPPDEELNVELLRGTLTKLLPEKNHWADDEYALLLRDLAKFEITTVGKLRDLISKNLDSALRYDKRKVEEVHHTTDSEGYIVGAETSLLNKGAYFCHTGLIRVMLSDKFPDFFERIMNYRFA